MAARTDDDPAKALDDAGISRGRSDDNTNTVIRRVKNGVCPAKAAKERQRHARLTEACEPSRDPGAVSQRRLVQRRKSARSVGGGVDRKRWRMNPEC